MRIAGRSKVVVTILAVFCVIAGITIGVVVREIKEDSSADNYNALFNFGDSGDVGYFIYSRRGGCRDLQDLDQEPLVLVVSPSQVGQEKVDVRQMKACLEFRKGASGEASPTKCAGGVATFDAATHSKERTGSYSVTLQDNRQRSGKFVAGLCARK